MLPQPISWVRIKSGIYEGDIGVVTRILNEDKVEVKLIPRVDPSGRSNVWRSGAAGFASKRASGFKLPQRAFDPRIFKATNQQQRAVDQNKTFYCWMGMLFRKGFLYKQFTIK